jgi:3-oxoacyl-[acyl-carrier protein] reductase
MRLSDKIALVTGGGSGIGEAICVRLAEEGARVAVVDLDLAAAQLTAKLVGGLGVAADVTDSAAVDRAVMNVEAELGPLDILVNNAGIAGRENADRIRDRADKQIAEAATGTVSTPLDALVRLPDDEWEAMLAVHLSGTFYCTRAAARSMTARGTGAIVNIGSICGIEGCTGFPHYSAAKGAILAFTRCVGKELIVQGVRVNAIAPGFIDTPMLDVMSPNQRAVVQVSTPVGRLGRPQEIAATAAFLASDDAAFYVGETLSPNGGLVTV